MPSQAQVTALASQTAGMVLGGLTGHTLGKRTRKQGTGSIMLGADGGPAAPG